MELYDLSSVWFWGNPLLEGVPSYAAHLYHPVSYHILAQITANEYRKTKRLWVQSLFKYGTSVDELIDVVLHYKDAIKSGSDNPTRYIANQMNKTESRIRALKLLIQMDDALESAFMLAKSRESAEKRHVSSRKRSIQAPSANQVSKIMAEIPHICPANYEGCEGEFIGRFALCSKCYRKLGSHDPEKWGEITKAWLEPMVVSTRSQWKREARNIWYRRNYDHIPDYELEQLMDAA